MLLQLSRGISPKKSNRKGHKRDRDKQDYKSRDIPIARNNHHKVKIRVETGRVVGEERYSTGN